MAGNTYGHNFRITTFGESHGDALGVVVDGCPSGVSLCEEDIQLQLNKRLPGVQFFETPRKEQDLVKIVSGVFEGETLGTPITMFVQNKNHNSKDYAHLKDTFRTGHADYTYHLKYQHRDHRGGGRSSARETIGRVAGGAVALKILAQKGIFIQGYIVAIGDSHATFNHAKGGYNTDTAFINSSDNIIRAAHPDVYNSMMNTLKNTCHAGDAVGGKVEISISGLMGGVGEPVFRKLNAQLAGAIMSIPAVTGVEFGLGFEFASMTGTQISNLIGTHNHATENTGENNGGAVITPPSIYGGIQGGISNGETITLRYSIKPPSSKLKGGINHHGKEVVIGGRHDCFVGTRSIVVAESMVALCVFDLLTEHLSKH